MKGITMSKKSKSSQFAFPVKLIPYGLVSFSEFFYSDDAQRLYTKTQGMDDYQKAVAFLSTYQTLEICEAIQQAGHGDLLDSDEFQDKIVDLVEKLLFENFEEMLTNFCAERTKLAAQIEVQKGGV